MSKGPEQLKFEQAVGEKGSSRSQSGDLVLAQQRWHLAAEVLRDSADQLEARAASAPAVSDQTGAAMKAAFVRTAASMRDRAAKLEDGAQALGDAATTLHAAEQAKSQLRDLHDPGSWTGGTPVTDQELKAKSAHDTAVSSYTADRAHNESIAAQHNQAMDAQNEKSTAVMKKVYGYQDPVPEPGAYGAGHAQAPGSPGVTSGTASGGGTTTHSGTSTGGTYTGGHPSGGTHGGTFVGGGSPHPGNPTGTPQGDVGAPAANAGTLGGSSFTPTTAPASAGSVGTSLGGVGASLGAGIVGGAGGMLGAVRGGGALPTTSSAGAAGARSIGASSRSGGTSTLGRSTAARAGTLSAEEEAAMQRNGTAARTGAAAGSGRSGGTGAAGRNGTAGRSGRGAGAAGQSTRGRKRSGNATLDHMIIEEDWLADEGQSPAVLD